MGDLEAETASSPVADGPTTGHDAPRRRGRAALLHGHPVARLGHLGPERRLRRVPALRAAGLAMGRGRPASIVAHILGVAAFDRVALGMTVLRHLAVRLVGPGQHDAGWPPDPRGARLGPRPRWRRARSRHRPGARRCRGPTSSPPGTSGSPTSPRTSVRRPALLPQPRHPPARLAGRLAALGSARPDRPLVEPLRSNGAVRRPLGGRLPAAHPDRHDGWPAASLAHAYQEPLATVAVTVDLSVGFIGPRTTSGCWPRRPRPWPPAGWCRPPARCGTGRAPWSPRVARR